MLTFGSVSARFGSLLSTFGSLLVIEVILGVVWEASKNDAKQELEQFRNSGEMGGGGRVPYDNLWSVAVLGHSASWSLVVAKGQGVWLGSGHAVCSKPGGG